MACCACIDFLAQSQASYLLRLAPSSFHPPVTHFNFAAATSDFVQLPLTRLWRGLQNNTASRSGIQLWIQLNTILFILKVSFFAFPFASIKLYDKNGFWKEYRYLLNSAVRNLTLLLDCNSIYLLSPLETVDLGVGNIYDLCMVSQRDFVSEAWRY